MLSYFKSRNLGLIIASIALTALLLFRVYHTKSSYLLFLIWNLFLAFIPLFISQFMLIKKAWKWKRCLLIPSLFAWLLFFPNAPYIITDLIHLKKTILMPVWYDAGLIFGFAFIGLIAGFQSLDQIRNIVFKRGRTLLSYIITYSVLFLTAFGIYLGRFPRFNSWDIISNPGNLFLEIGDRIIHPFDHPQTIGVTIMYGIILSVIYAIIYEFGNGNKQEG